MGRLFLLDGYNIILQCPNLGKLARADLESSRQKLIDLVIHFCSVSDDRVVLVFDGRHKTPLPLDQSWDSAQVRVVFSKDKTSADAVIGRIVYDSRTEQREIIVVSADREVRELCQTLGAMVIKPGTFMGHVHDAHKRLNSACSRIALNTGKKYALQDFLNAESTSMLSELRRKLERDRESQTR